MLIDEDTLWRRGPLQLLLKPTRRPNEAIERSGETHDEGHDGSHQGAVVDGAFHEIYNDFKRPTGPVPEQ
eukprot:8715834-Prorocentrum_lima.AAC.1